MTGGVVVLGATGSVGRQALDVLRARGERPRVLTAHRDAAGLAALCREFLPEACVIADEKYNELKLLLADTPVRFPRAGAMAAAAAGRLDTAVDGAALAVRYLRLSQAERERQERLKADKQTQGGF